MNKKILLMKLLSFMPDKLFNTIFFLYKNNYIPNLDNPKSFNEKINYLKMNSTNKKRVLAADRIKVRDFVQRYAPECKLINILWTGKGLDLKTYNELPEKFVIKANHGSGMVKIVQKNEINYDELKEEIDWWLNIDYGRITRQNFYSQIEKILIVEEYLNPESRDLPDFKFMCINGEVEFVQVDSERFTSHKRSLYDKSFKPINVQYSFPLGKTIKKPKKFEDAVKIAEKLASQFDLIRVDLYLLENGDIYFGELTNTPDNGFGKFIPFSFELNLGEKIKFNKEFLNE